MLSVSIHVKHELDMINMNMLQEKLHVLFHQFSVRGILHIHIIM